MTYTQIHRSLLVLCIALLAVISVRPAFAVKPDEMLKDPVLEERARDISSGLRCLVCQNQSIDDSDAPLARDLRILVRDRLEAGDTDAEVRSFLVDRYGEFVLLKPSFSNKNLVLWSFAPLVLILGVVTIFLLYRRNRLVEAQAKRNGAMTLSAEEQERLNKILSDDDPS